MAKCRACKAPLEDDAIFCSNCGAVLEPEKGPLSVATRIAALLLVLTALSNGGLLIFGALHHHRVSAGEPFAVALIYVQVALAALLIGRFRLGQWLVLLAGALILYTLGYHIIKSALGHPHRPYQYWSYWDLPLRLAASFLLLTRQARDDFRKWKRLPAAVPTP